MTTATSINSTAQDELAILALIEGMAKARYDRNPRAIAAPYTPDAVIFMTLPAQNVSLSKLF
jgi:hypothetical protein